ncbi:MAG: hypothetical protein JXA98_05335 [Methanosarcinaceae archaeon]|nr:hypothetical protein [Methanosarcinaceae archaeon]
MKDITRNERLELRLYVAGQTQKSIASFANLKKMCEQYPAGRYQILAVPTLVHKLTPTLNKNNMESLRYRNDPCGT